MNECTEIKKNLGLSRCVKIPQMPRCMITTGLNFKFEAADLVDDATFKAAVEAAISAGYADRIYLWPLFSGFENTSEATVYEQNASGSMFVRNGKYRFRFMITQDMCVHTAMYSHRSPSGRVFILDLENQMMGTKDVDGNFYGYTYSLINPENLILSDGSVATKSPIFVELADPTELNKNGVLVPAAFINTVDRLTDVHLTKPAAPAATATKVNVIVKNECDGFALEGLAKEDFKFLTAAGAVQTIVSIAYKGDGVYELTGVAFVAGTVDLVAAADLTVKAYESLGPVTITIP